jgi:hypothetical protein
MRRELLLAAVGLAVLMGPGMAWARPCLLDANDKPIDCPQAAPAQPVAKNATEPTKAPPIKGCANPKTGKAIKCPPRMLTPQPLSPDQ